MFSGAGEEYGTHQPGHGLKSGTLYPILRWRSGSCWRRRDGEVWQACGTLQADAGWHAVCAEHRHRLGAGVPRWEAEG